MPKLKNWGGIRPGAGRKVTGQGKRLITTIALEPGLLAALESYAKQAGISRNEAVHRLLSESLLSNRQESVPGVSVKQVSKGSSQSVNEPAKKQLPEWFTNLDKPTLPEVVEDYSPLEFGQWFVQNLPELSKEQKDSFREPWRNAPSANLDGFRRYGDALIGAIKAGKIKLHPGQAAGMGSMKDPELRRVLLNLAEIKL